LNENKAVRTFLSLLLFCVCLSAAAGPKVTVSGQLSRAMAIGGESTGWTIHTDPKITVNDHELDSIEVEYKDAEKLNALANKTVRASGRIEQRQGVETGTRSILKISKIKEVKAATKQ
jgi:hypothetical protein